MGIEIRPPAALSSAHGKTTVDDGRARTQGASARSDTPAVSFLSLLGAMGGGLPADAKVSLADALPAEELPSLVLPADALPTDAPPADALPADALPTGAAFSPDTVATAMALQPDLVPAQNSVSGVAPSGLAVEQQAAPRSGKLSENHRPGTPGVSPELDASPTLTSSPGHKDTRALQHAATDTAALQGQMDKPAPAASARDFLARVEAARTAAETEAVAPRASTAAAGAVQAATPQLASLFDLSAAGQRSGSASRAQERTNFKAAAPGAGVGFAAWGDATPAGTSHGASAVYAPGAMTPAPATAMAEKMHYWVSRGVQSAELQLDAFAGGSVDVSISVKGDMAMVEFRTDQPQARQLLQDAMPQLKDLLASEGLMLSGGFVGGSMTQQGSPSRDRDGQPGTVARPAGSPVRVLEPAAGSTVATRTAAGRSVDLFV
jgi:flagellar hook-length control protein FliK